MVFGKETYEAVIDFQTVEHSMISTLAGSHDVIYKISIVYL